MRLSTAIAFVTIIMLVFLFPLMVFAIPVLPASQPATAALPAALPAPPTDIGGIAAILFGAFQNHQWPVVIMGVIEALLVYERHWVGLTGQKVSDWLGSPLGVAVTTFVMAVATAGWSVAVNGWRAIGSACALAAIMGAINLIGQLPLKK